MCPKNRLSFEVTLFYDNNYSLHVSLVSVTKHTLPQRNMYCSDDALSLLSILIVLLIVTYSVVLRCLFFFLTFLRNKTTNDETVNKPTGKKYCISIVSPRHQ